MDFVRADEARTTNVLSGSARSAAQVHTVHGGLHFHDAAPQQAGRSVIVEVPAGHVLSIAGVALLVVALCVVSLLVVGRRIPATVVVWPSPPSGTTRPSGSVEFDVPVGLDHGGQHYFLQIPEMVEIFSLQAYPCAGRPRQRAVIGYLRLPRNSPFAGFMLRDLVGRFIVRTWVPEGTPRSGLSGNPARPTRGDGRALDGRELAGRVRIAGDDTCASDAVLVNVLVVDEDEYHDVAIVSVGFKAAVGYGEGAAARDLRTMAESVVFVE